MSGSINLEYEFKLFEDFVHTIYPKAKINKEVAILMLKIRIIQRIEKALYFELHDWQKQYLFRDDDIPTEIYKERNNGKTTITIIKDILSQMYKEVIYLTPIIRIPPNQRYYRNMFLDIYNRLNKGGFKLPKIEYGPPCHHN